jgi:hypothetical protein
VKGVGKGIEAYQKQLIILTNEVFASGFGQCIPHNLLEERLDLLHIGGRDVKRGMDDDARHNLGKRLVGDNRSSGWGLDGAIVLTSASIHSLCSSAAASMPFLIESPAF